MENRTELYFTTGEFARILGVKKHTLFHYDQIGLFSPALKEETDTVTILSGRWMCSRSSSAAEAGHAPGGNQGIH